MDPITIIVAALAAGAAAGLKPTAEQVVKDAYTGLKSFILSKYGAASVAALEQKPESEAKRASVAEDLAEAGAGDDEALLDQAKALLDMVKAYERETAATIGVDLEAIEAEYLKVKQVNQLMSKIIGVGVGGWVGVFAGKIDIEDVTLRPRRTQRQTLQPIPEAERHISVWINERPEGPKKTLQVGQVYTLNFKVGQPVQASLVSGPETIVPSSDVPPEGLPTEWVITSSTVELAEVTSDTFVTNLPLDGTTAWMARFSLLIPKEGESAVPQLLISPRSARNTCLNVVIYAKREIYRQFTVQLAVEESASPEEATFVEAISVGNELLHAPAAHLGLRTTHEWTTPPGELSIAVIGQALAYVRGDAGPTFVNQMTKWSGVQAKVAGPIENVHAAAERFRARWEDYLNDIDPDDLAQRLQQWTPDYVWAALGNYADEHHQQTWEEVRISSELRDLAYDGHSLYEAFFPPGSELRTWIDALTPGHRLDISWLETSGPGWIPHIPWGLMYLPDPPALDEPVDPMGFLALRFRIDYTAHEIQTPSKALGHLADTYGTYFLYWGDQPQDKTGMEARWQRQQWATWQNQVFIPTSPGTNSKTELIRLLSDPEPNPVAVLYLFCQCTVGEGNNPVLRFGGTSQAADVLKRTELGAKLLKDQPLVFANACTTAATDPYIANELERSFFNRGCRAYLGTESKVPIQFASRFASIFFHFFYRQLDPAPMPAGEAVAQTRLFLWTRYQNIGGIFYTYINQYELFMAQDSEVLALRY